MNILTKEKYNDVKNALLESCEDEIPKGRTFELTEEQELKYLKWSMARPKKNSGAIGGRYTFSFTPTSLGVIIKVIDDFNKEFIDLTEYESW